jgi:phosphoribosylglycinamide formyltransferase-1
MARATNKQAEQRRARLVTICEALPDVETTGDQHLNFRVHGKVIAYYLDDHHGDGMIVVSVKTTPTLQAMLVEDDPARYSLTPYMAHRGWVSLRIDGRSVDWEEVAALVQASYRLVAPKRLASQVPEA